MTPIASEVAASPDPADFRAAVERSSESDRAFASTVAVNVIEVIKAFNAVKGRLHGQSHADSFDFALLIKLAKQGPMRGIDLAEHLCADPSTVSRQVASLVKAGLLERQADPHDGRASILVPTEAGLARIDQMIEMRGQIFAPIVAHWSADDRDTFVRLLADFASGLNANLDAIKNIAADLVRSDAMAQKS